MRALRKQLNLECIIRLPASKFTERECFMFRRRITENTDNYSSEHSQK